MKPPNNIVAANERARFLGAEHFSALKIDWSKANQDKRAGTIHAWGASKEYLGQFRTHDRAIASGAAVTQFQGMWFVWGE
jgi:hypothetical protein